MYYGPIEMLKKRTLVENMNIILTGICWSTNCAINAENFKK